MAKEIQGLEQKFALDITWPANPVTGGDKLLDASFGQIGIQIGSSIATAFQSDKGDTGTQVDVPLYDMAEWLTKHWWQLLYEPKEGELPETDDYRERHWLGAARRGWALPSVWFNPTGDEIELSCESSYLRFARLTFTETAETSVVRQEVEVTLRDFVARVIERLSVRGLADTPAHRYWQLILDTPKEAELYCRLVGSMGLSPYDDNPVLSEALSAALDRGVPESVLVDICEAADSTSIRTALDNGSSAVSKLATVEKSDLSALTEIEVPSDNPYSAPWRWGIECSRRIQSELGISPYDVSGSDKFFEATRISTRSSNGNESGADQISAAMRRNDSDLWIALHSHSEPQQRFAAVRAAFIALTGPTSSTRLITAAKTRRQQASRAFAAQMLAPYEFIRARSTNQQISAYRVQEMAEQLNVSPSVVKHQATNNHIMVVG